MQPQKMQKYLFKAHTTALRGTIRKPYYQELGEHLAVGTYAGSAVHMETSNKGFAVLGDISYEFARTEVIAAQVDDNTFRSTVTAEIRGLKIGRRLTAGEVICRLTSEFDARTYPGRCLPRISPAGSAIRDLRIDGQVQNLQLPPAFDPDQKTLGAFFMGERDADKGLEPGPIAEPIRIKDFGTIYYAEWTWVHPQERHQQKLNMLRLALGSDFGADVDVCSGDSDGTGWPPTAP